MTLKEKQDKSIMDPSVFQSKSQLVLDRNKRTIKLQSSVLSRIFPEENEIIYFVSTLYLMFLRQIWRNKYK